MNPCALPSLLAAFVLVACSGGTARTVASSPPAGSAAPAPSPSLRAPDVPDALRVPASSILIAHFHAAGAQVYSCAERPGADSGSPYAWKLKQPDAQLLDETGAVVGAHGAGPSWTSKDGSTIVAKKVAQVDAPDPDAVPWLLLQAVTTGGHGIFSAVTYVQRVETAHGRAPVSGCDASSLGTLFRSAYAAEYYFYGGP